jgi:tight adherence protein C
VVLIGIATFIVTNMMFNDESQFKASEKLEEGVATNDFSKHGIVLRYSRPFFKRYISPIVSSLKNKKWIREKYKKKLAGAGLQNYITPEDFYSFKLFLIVGFPIVFMAVRTFLEETWPLTLIPIMAIVGFFYPDIWINGKIKSRQQEVIRSMPFCVDMLALSVEAGLDFVAAMSKVIEKARRSALTEEFETVIKEIRVGASRAEALRNMAWRLDMIQMSSFTATLIAADSVGASIGPILKALSVEIRQKRSAEVEKAGATAATKILFPMLFLIVPAVFLIVMAPLFLQMMGKK